MKITKEAVHRIYTLSQKVYDSTYTAKKAIDFIKTENIMSEGSARIYFNIFKSLMNGVGHTRAMNEYSTIYFLDSIYKDYGKNKLILALKATAAHVTYYNSLGKGNRQSISDVITQFNDKYDIEDEIYTIFPDEVEGDLFEGARKKVSVNIYERSQHARNKCIAVHGLNCAVCAFNFENAYGDIGIGFIHVHHVVDIASIKAEYKVDPSKDLAPVCPNCHAMLHKTKPAMSIESLKSKLKIK